MMAMTGSQLDYSAMGADLVLMKSHCQKEHRMTKTEAQNEGYEIVEVDIDSPDHETTVKKDEFRSVTVKKERKKSKISEDVIDLSIDDTIPESFTCEKCGRAFLTQDYLSHHVNWECNYSVLGTCTVMKTDQTVPLQEQHYIQAAGTPILESESDDNVVDDYNMMAAASDEDEEVERDDRRIQNTALRVVLPGWRSNTKVKCSSSSSSPRKVKQKMQRIKQELVNDNEEDIDDVNGEGEQEALPYVDIIVKSEQGDIDHASMQLKEAEIILEDYKKKENKNKEILAHKDGSGPREYYVQLVDINTMTQIELLSLQVRCGIHNTSLDDIKTECSRLRKTHLNPKSMISRKRSGNDVVKIQAKRKENKKKEILAHKDGSCPRDCHVQLVDIRTMTQIGLTQLMCKNNLQRVIFTHKR